MELFGKKYILIIDNSATFLYNVEKSKTMMGNSTLYSYSQRKGGWCKPLEELLEAVLEFPALTAVADTSVKCLSGQLVIRVVPRSKSSSLWDVGLFYFF